MTFIAGLFPTPPRMFFEVIVVKNQDNGWFDND